MKSLLVVWCFLVFGSFVYGQTAKLQKANKYYRDLNFQQAIPLYESILSKQVVPEALFNLPDCFRRTGRFVEAERWYGQAALHPEAQPIIHYYLGLMRLSNGKPREAKIAFERFRELAPNDTRGPRLLAACSDSVRTDLMNSGALYVVSNVEDLNTPFDEFGVSFYDKGFVFASERDTGYSVLRRSAWTGRPFLDIFYVESRLVDEDKMEFRYTKPEKFDSRIQSKYHEGNVAFVQDQRQMYLTRNRFNKKRAIRDEFGLVKVGISSSKYVDGRWTLPKEVKPFDNPAYSYLHPTLTADGTKMFFASNHEGGFGGYDLFVSYLEGDRWSEPINLGPTINTEGDEVFPFVAEDGTLYFSSDGHGGLGGFDVYYAKANKGVWSNVENMGAPINSPWDDVSFVLHTNKKFGYFASNREGGAGNTDIYYFSKLAIQTEFLVVDKLSGRGVEGIKLSCECLPKRELVTDVDGRVSVSLPLNRSCRFTILDEAFEGISTEVSTVGYPLGSELLASLPLEISQLSFRVEGSVVDEETGEAMEGVNLSLQRSCQAQSVPGRTGSGGVFEFDLEPSCCYVVKATKEGYFTGTANFCTKGLFRSDTLAASIRMAKIKKPKGAVLDTSSRYVIDNIYYETGKATLNEEASLGLARLLELLQENPEYGVEITSHTDSRGTEAKNATLSTRRAKAVADYLVKKGVEPLRVTYRGAGEAELVNGCRKGVSCTEEQHRENRRTEFRIFKIR